MLRIAVTGPESTGKSSLSKGLAKSFQAELVEEQARNYLDQLGREYVEWDVLKIARSQIQAIEEAAALDPEILIVDTELLVIKLWLEHKYGSAPDWLLQALDDQSFDLFLLCNVDLPWEADPLRENPELGAYFFELFKQELEDRSWPYVVISGRGEQRTQMAHDAVQAFLEKEKKL